MCYILISNVIHFFDIKFFSSHHTWYQSYTNSLALKTGYKLILIYLPSKRTERPSWPWSYGSWIYNYKCDQCLSPLMLWVKISIRARYTTLCDKVCQWLAIGQWFPPGPPVSTTYKTDRHDIAKIFLKVALNTIKQTDRHTNKEDTIYIYSTKWTWFLLV